MGRRDNVPPLRDLLLLAIHLFVTIAKLLRSGAVRAVAAESLILNQQLIVSNRSRQRAPNLTTVDRFVLGLIILFVSPRRIPKLASIVKSATSAPITIRSSAFIAGSKICVYLKLTRSTRFPMFPCRIHLSNGSSAPYAESISIAYSLAMRLIWSVS